MINWFTILYYLSEKTNCVIFFGMFWNEGGNNSEFYCISFFSLMRHIFWKFKILGRKMEEYNKGSISRGIWYLDIYIIDKIS